jgi:hypothetical protein
MWDPEHNLLGTEKKNGMEPAHITNDGRSISEEGTMTESPWGRETEDDQWKDGETDWCKQIFGLEEEEEEEEEEHMFR